MKRFLIFFLILILISGDLWAATLKVNSRNFTSEPTMRRRITLSLAEAGPVTASPWLIAGDHVANFTDTNGVTYFSNVLAAEYRLDIAGSPSRSFPISVFDTNGVIDASLIVNSTNYNAAYYTAAQVDALIVGAAAEAGALTNGHVPDVTLAGGLFVEEYVTFGANATPTNANFPGFVLNVQDSDARSGWDETSPQGSLFYNTDLNRLQFQTVPNDDDGWRTVMTTADNVLSNSHSAAVTLKNTLTVSNLNGQATLQNTNGSINLYNITQSLVIDKSATTLGNLLAVSNIVSSEGQFHGNGFGLSNITAAIAPGKVTLRQYGAAADANLHTGEGTDDSAAFQSAIAARPAGSFGFWVIDGEGLNYKINSATVVLYTNHVKLVNFNAVITNFNRSGFVLGGDFSSIEDAQIIGPGTNATMVGEVASGVFGIMVTNAPWLTSSDYVVHPSIKNVKVWSFDRNVIVSGMEHGTIEDSTFNNARTDNLYISRADGSRFVGNHPGSETIVNGSAAYAAPFFPTNSADRWLSNSVAIRIVGPANDLTFINTSGGGGKHTFHCINANSITIDGLHIENMRNFDPVAAVNVFSNTTGINIRNAFMVKVAGSDGESPQAFGWLFLDSMSQAINFDAYGPWGTSPFVAAYYNPTAHEGAYLGPVSSAENRKPPRIYRGGVTYRVLTDLTSMAGTDTVLNPAGTMPTMDSLNIWSASNKFTGTLDVRNKITHWYSSDNGLEWWVGAPYGTTDDNGDNFTWGIYGRRTNSFAISLLTYQASHAGNRTVMRHGGDWGSGHASVMDQEFYTSNTNFGGQNLRWTLNNAGAFFPDIATNGLGTTAKPLGSVVIAGSLPVDDVYSGNSIAGLNAGATIAQWEVVYMGTGFEWLLADANGSSTYPAIGLAATAGTDNNAMTVVTGGVVRNDAWNWSVGPIYLSATPGALTQTAPSTTGDKVQVIGFALSADSMLVKPSSDYGTAP
jgi:hypothetical protein